MKNKKNVHIPTYDELFIPTILSLQELGGSGTVEEINNKVFEIAQLTDDVLQIPHNGDNSRSEVEYRLAWSKTYLKKYGLLENSSRGVWSLAKSNIDINNLNNTEIVKSVREQSKTKTKRLKPSKADALQIDKEIKEDVDNAQEWKDILIDKLYTINPNAFERLAQRILRESGFSQVEVTGKSGDGGIDGKGIVRISGLLSFQVIFQCKRYKGSVSPSQIRDFRGAMQGRADKGLFITTGSFTREAIKEATRDGAPPIDLIDGEMLCDKLKELNLGVKTVLIEDIEINKDWFDNI